MHVSFWSTALVCVMRRTVNGFGSTHFFRRRSSALLCLSNRFSVFSFRLLETYTYIFISNVWANSVGTNVCVPTCDRSKRSECHQFRILISLFAVAKSCKSLRLHPMLINETNIYMDNQRGQFSAVIVFNFAWITFVLGQLLTTEKIFAAENDDMLKSVHI